MLFGAYPKERVPWIEPALQSAVETHRGEVLLRREAQRAWDERFFLVSSLGLTPRPGRALVQGARLAQTLLEIEGKLAGVAIYGTVSLRSEVSLLAFDPAEGSTGIVDFSAVADIELLEVASRSWMPPRR